MNNKKISLIIPVYNTEKYLERCLNCVENQTYQNLEIILINDGSSDNSLEIIQKHAATDSRIILINQKNAGGGAARNAGLDIATGDYIGFVDSDDQIELSMYEIMMNAIHQYNTEMCICDYCTEASFDSKKEIHAEVMDNHQLMEELLKDEKISSHFWRKLYPAKVFKTNRFSSKKVVHDMSLDHILCSEIMSAVHIDAPLYIYTEDNPNNLSNSNAKGLASSYNRAKVMMERLDFADQNYPDLSYILLPKAAMFLLSSYAKLSLLYKDKKEEMEYVISSIKKEEDRFMSSSDLPLSHKVILWSIAHNVKPVSYLASQYYLHSIQ